MNKDTIEKAMKDHSFVMVPSFKTFFRVTRQEFLCVYKTEPETFADASFTVTHGTLYLIDRHAFGSREVF